MVTKVTDDNIAWSDQLPYRSAARYAWTL